MLSTKIGSGSEAKIQRLIGITAINNKNKNSLKSTQKIAAVPSLRPCPLSMSRIREFYQRYRQYILSDGLMYLVFIVALALMFVFFG
jgi:hypothetical protein